MFTLTYQQSTELFDRVHIITTRLVARKKIRAPALRAWCPSLRTPFTPYVLSNTLILPLLSCVYSVSGKGLERRPRAVVLSTHPTRSMTRRPRTTGRACGARPISDWKIFFSLHGQTMLSLLHLSVGTTCGDVMTAFRAQECCNHLDQEFDTLWTCPDNCTAYSKFEGLINWDKIASEIDRQPTIEEKFEMATRMLPWDHIDNPLRRMYSVDFIDVTGKPGLPFYAPRNFYVTLNYFFSEEEFQRNGVRQIVTLTHTFDPYTGLGTNFFGVPMPTMHPYRIKGDSSIRISTSDGGTGSLTLYHELFQTLGFGPIRNNLGPTTFNLILESTQSHHQIASKIVSAYQEYYNIDLTTSVFSYSERFSSMLEGDNQMQRIDCTLRIQEGQYHLFAFVKKEYWYPTHEFGEAITDEKIDFIWKSLETYPTALGSAFTNVSSPYLADVLSQMNEIWMQHGQPPIVFPNAEANANTTYFEPQSFSDFAFLLERDAQILDDMNE